MATGQIGRIGQTVQLHVVQVFEHDIDYVIIHLQLNQQMVKMVYHVLVTIAI